VGVSSRVVPAARGMLARHPAAVCTMSGSHVLYLRRISSTGRLSKPLGNSYRAGTLDRVPEVLVRARGLAKQFGSFTAVNGIDFDVYQGEAFGFLGPNGAGKSSTMRMISCVSPPTAGELSILGRDPRRDGPAIRARLGVVPQEDTLDVELTVRENLLVYGRYFGLPRAVIRERTEQLLDFVQLADRANDMVEPLSGGMKRRLTIARSLINDPDILILDEPTTGLDPQARHVVWDRLFRLKQRGVTLILTTHYMDEAEQLCDRLVVMDHARIAAEGSPRELLARYSTAEVLELRFPLDAHDQAAEQIKIMDTERTRLVGANNFSAGTAPPPPGPPHHPAPGPPHHCAGPVRSPRPGIEVLADRILLYVPDGDAALAEVVARGLAPTASLVRRATLEDVFLRLTGRTLED
jgi:lipooligosaccharide transport system ATP-binding protein